MNPNKLYTIEEIVTKEPINFTSSIEAVKQQAVLQSIFFPRKPSNFKADMEYRATQQQNTSRRNSHHGGTHLVFPRFHALKLSCQSQITNVHTSCAIFRPF